MTEGELINFSVSIDEIDRFLKSSGDRLPLKESSTEKIEECPKAVELLSGRTDADDGNLLSYDTDCDKIADLVAIVPDDENQPLRLEADTSGNGKIDTVIFDQDRDGAWDYSMYDYSGNGEVDLIGCHSNGMVDPTSLHLYNSDDPFAVCAN